MEVSERPDRMTGDGVMEWRDAQGRLHRDDGPARVLPSGREEWYRHGLLHREDGPANRLPGESAPEAYGWQGFDGANLVSPPTRRSIQLKMTS